MSYYSSRRFKFELLCNWNNWGFSAPWFFRLSFCHKFPFTWSHFQIGRFVLFWERNKFWTTKHIEYHPE